MRPLRCHARHSDSLIRLALLYIFATKGEVTTRLDDVQESVLCYLKQHASSIVLEHAGSQAPADGRALFSGSSNLSHCAIVSSSGALLWHRFGAEIDSHDTVIRFNDAPSGSAFTPYVGKKSSVRVSGYKGFHRLGYQEGEIYIDAAGPEPERHEEMENGVPSADLYVFKKEPRDQLKKVLTEVLSERWMLAGECEGRSMRPTMGALGTLLALQFCDYVDLYDMTPSQASARAPYHYYTDDHELDGKSANTHEIGADHNTWHIDFSAEKHLWESLSITNRSEVRRTGKATIPGFSALSCDRGADSTKSLRKPFVGDKGNPDCESRSSKIALHATPQAMQQTMLHGFLACAAALFLAGGIFVCRAWHKRRDCLQTAQDRGELLKGSDNS